LTCKLAEQLPLRVEVEGEMETPNVPERVPLELHHAGLLPSYNTVDVCADTTGADTGIKQKDKKNNTIEIEPEIFLFLKLNTSYST